MGFPIPGLSANLLDSLRYFKKKIIPQVYGTRVDNFLPGRNMATSQAIEQGTEPLVGSQYTDSTEEFYGWEKDPVQ